MSSTDVLGAADARVSKSVVEASLLGKAPFDFLFVEAKINLADVRGALLPTSCLRRKSWRHDKRRREYVADYDLNVSQWEGKHDSPDAATEIIREIERCACIVIAQVAFECGDAQDAIASFLEKVGITLDQIGLAQSPLTAVSNIASGSDHLLEVSIRTDDLSVEEALISRKRWRTVLEGELSRLGLGRFDGESSGSGAVDLGFRVSDPLRAKSALTQVLLEAGRAPGSFTVEEI